MTIYFCMQLYIKFYNMNLNTICQGCLSQDRHLKCLGEFENVLKALFHDGPDTIKMDIVTSNLQFCWECLKILQNIKTFQNKVFIAQQTLLQLVNKKSHNCNFETLSNLSITTQIQLHKGLYTKKKLETLSEITIVKVEQPANSSTESVKLHLKKDPKKKRKNTENDISFNIDILENIKQESGFEDSFDYEVECFESDPDFKPSFKAVKEEKTKNTTSIEEKKNDIPSKDIKPYQFNRRWFDNHRSFYSVVPGNQSECDQIENEDVNIDISLKGEDQFATLHCAKCNETCLNMKDYKSHMNAHDQTYKCRICKEDTIYKEDDIIQHVKTKHRFLGVRCGFCRARFVSHIELEAHSKDCGVYRCNDCTQVFKGKKKLEMHCRSHLTYTCRLCNQTYKNYRTYQSHMHVRHNTTKTEAAYCVECDLHFASDVLMRRHLQSGARHVPESVKAKRYPCSECSNVYKRVTTRNYHYNLAHVGITKFYCRPCDKYYLNNYQLRRHTKTKHQNIQIPKNKLCSYCGRGFSSNKVLQHHIYTHTGEKPYECSYCGARYAQKYARNMHMKHIHKHGIER